jgi:hypothetical protein
VSGCHPLPAQPTRAKLKELRNATRSVRITISTVRLVVIIASASSVIKTKSFHIDFVEYRADDSIINPRCSGQRMLHDRSKRASPEMDPEFGTG